MSGWRGPGELFAVTDLDSAKRALAEIVEQSEGASPLNPEDGFEELAHFYRFEEIVRGRRLVPEDGGGYGDTGAEIHFDPTASGR